MAKFGLRWKPQFSIGSNRCRKMSLIRKSSFFAGLIALVSTCLLSCHSGEKQASSDKSIGSSSKSTNSQNNTQDDCLVVIDRKNRRLKVLSKNGTVTVYDTAIGIGRGGLGVKKNMADCITPSGDFVVDLILYKPEYNAVEESLRKRFPEQAEYLDSPEGLQKLLANMSSIDFNGDSKPDTAYGAAYIGLDSSNAITGPKMSDFNGTTYWFSIALHGTSNEKRNIGYANSGGCIQIPETILKPLIEKHIIHIGSHVKIEK
jgi:hypothetical protein